MDKQTFYAELSDRLVRLNVGRDYIERHFKQFDSYFQGKSEEEVAHEIEKLGDLDRVAARIKRMTDKIRTTETTNVEEADPQSPQPEAPKKTSAKKIPTVPVNDDEALNEVPDTSSGDADQEVFAKRPAGKPISQIPVIPTEPDEVEPESGKRRGAHDDSYLSRITEAAPDDEAIRKNRLKFWILFAVTLPITVSILAATGATFALIFFAIAVLIILAVALLVVITASGTLVTLFGLIFGAAQMLSSMPIGLYECGLSIMIGSAAMFVGILVYNFAVRLLPFVAKWLLILMRFILKKYRQLFVFLKREVIGL